MKPVKSVRLNVFLRLFVLLLSSSLVSCGSGSYSATAPGANKREAMAALEAAAPARTTDDTLGYVFSDNVFTYQPCVSPAPPCPEILTVGNPVHAYAIDLVSGMPSPKGMPGDTLPVNTKSIAVSPTGRFLYVLTGDDLLYTFSVGYSVFAETEFKEQNLNPLNLYSALSKAVNITGTALSAEDIVNQLNALLERPDLYAQISASSPTLSESAEIKKLKTDTANSRTMLFGDLAESEQKSIIRLNRLMIELAYPDITPVNKGADAQHVVGTPLATLPAYYNQYRSFASIESEPLGKFVYVLGRKVVDGYTTDPTAGAQTPIIKQALSVYVRDAASGQLTLSETQILPIDQLIFAKSGLVAYGSNNGSLHTYSVNRNTGLLTEVGTPFQFEGWQAGEDFNVPSDPTSPWFKTPFRNMAADRSGKFLFLIGSSGHPWDPPPDVGCDAAAAWHQLGSLIYTFFIDANSGLLTQAGPPVDTTPHIMTSVAADPKGRFVQVLNTHEYYPGAYRSACVGGLTSPLDVGAIYSYNVDQASGALFPSGSVQAGGAQLPSGQMTSGYELAGRDSVSLTGDVTGRFLYLLSAGDMYAYNVDQANGALTPIGSPLTGATVTAMPGAYKTPGNPDPWPSDCYTDGVWNKFCTFKGSRSHSLTWAGY